ncbi:MAG: hypothetical protein AAGC93_18950 [Cyanobacteria bacterium P01_F01_bin.53]
MNFLPTTPSSQSNVFQTRASQVSSSKSTHMSLLGGEHSSAALLAILLATGGVALTGQAARAQTASNIQFNAATGAVQIDNNAFDIQTGALENESNIPLPVGLPAETREGVALPVDRGSLAPNSIEITPDLDYIHESVNSALGNEENNTNYELDRDSLQLNTQFDLSQKEGSHAYGEGIEATVFDGDGSVVSRESTFVRGGSVRIGPDGEELPTESQLNVLYGADDTVELRVLNIRRNGNDPDESGIYFSEDGEFIVEDLQNGGDLDFDDGNYVQLSGGKGQANAVQEREVVSIETDETETPLDPDTRVEEVVEQDVIESVVESDTVAEEEREYGGIEAPDTVSTRLGHATGAVTEEGEHLVYDQYSGAAQISAGSDGIGITGQLKPLVNNPNVPPTLLTGNATFNPFVGDNEAGLTGTLSVTQFLNPTHRLATDAAGNVINNPNADGRPLVEPGGLFTNRQMVGYVPSTPAAAITNEQIFSSNGIFELPSDKPVVISPADSQQVGRGNAAYTDNVGGFIVEEASGAMRFIPQWTKAGYAQEDVSLEAGEATRIIYALVPQQAGQNLTLNQTYEVTEGANGYQITNGGFSIISADRQPQNFVEETSEIYAVEDTVRGQNAATNEFNGVQGVYAETLGGEPEATVDVGLAAEADARVGNTLFPVSSPVIGQNAYSRTTRALGFYLGGAVTGGIGNQRDTVRRTTIEMDRVVNELRTQTTFNTFMTPQLQRDSVVTERTETTQDFGTAFFDINSNGELTNVSFIEGDSETVSVSNAIVDRQTEVIRGEEVLVSSETTETVELLSSDMVEMDRETTDGSDSYANFSSVQGELALGGVLNFGNTPWSTAANTFRAELFARDTVIGRSGNGSEVGWRAEAIFHPFGEVQREAYQYDEAGNAVPVYQTEAVLADDGEQMMETITDVNGRPVNVGVNRFALDADGNRMPQMVGTGDAKGPGVYVRVEDAFDDDEGVVVAGGLQLSF